MSKYKVLLVDDEWNMRNLIKIYLRKEGFDVHEVSTGQDALLLFAQQQFDLILLDVMMPDQDGWQVCRAIREISNVPVLMLTARTDTKDKVLGLGIGADDYVTKPFHAAELIARIYSLLRRARMSPSVEEGLTIVSYPNFMIYADAREVFVHDERVDFTPKEFELLCYLAQRSQRAFARDELVERLWGYEYTGDTRVIDTHVKNIREKLQRAGLGYNPIETVWGVGYKFTITGAEG